VEYSFGVVAENAVGESAVSDMTPPVVPAVGLFAYEHDFDENGILFHLGCGAGGGAEGEVRRHRWINPSSGRLGSSRVEVSSSDTVVHLHNNVMQNNVMHNNVAGGEEEAGEVGEVGEAEEAEEAERRLALSAVTGRSSTMLHLWGQAGDGSGDECNWVMLDLGRRRRLLPTRYKLHYALTPVAGNGWALEG
jgi:hypothetical protein